jgi:hypothetical protein
MDLKIDWSKFKFISKKDEWYVEGTEVICLFDYGEPKLTNIVEDNVGMFDGYTNETYNGYIGELHRPDEEGCSFDEFDIYLNDELVNQLTYQELYKKLL